MSHLIALMMEAARTSETLVNFYQTTRRYNPQDSHLRSHRRQNLKSYLRHDLVKNRAGARNPLCGIRHHESRVCLV
jgi:hypothetical protein